MKEDYADERHRPHDELPAPWCIAVDAILEEPTPLMDTRRIRPDAMVQVNSSKTLLSPNIAEHSVIIGAVPRLQVVRYGSAIAVTVALAFALAWIGVFDRGARIAFAQVQKKIETVRSVQFTETRNAAHGQPAKMSRVLILGRYLKRVEHLDESSNVARISITDANRGKHVVIYPDRKLFKVLTTQVTRSLDSDERTESDIKPWPDADFYAYVRDFKPDPSHEPNRRKIEGEPALSFLQATIQNWANGESSTVKRVIWVNEQTKLPVRIEISDRSTDKRLAPSDWIQEKFIFNAELDESLFSTDPPEGYRVQTSEVIGISPTLAKP